MAEILATEEDIHEVERMIAEAGSYDPREWGRRYMDRWHFSIRVEFTEEEEKMIREMAHKTGYPCEDIVRTAVRDLYVHIIVGR